MAYSNGSDFIEEYEQGASKEVLLEALSVTVARIVNSVFRSSKMQDASVSREDIAQEVKLYLWAEKLQILIDMKDISTKNVYKYAATLIKRQAYRATMEVKFINPRLKDKRRAKDNNLSLSRINLEFFDYAAEYPTINLVETFLDKCKGIENADTVFNFLTEADFNEEFAGLNPNTYFSTLSQMKDLAKQIAAEVPYGA